MEKTTKDIFHRYISEFIRSCNPKNSNEVISPITPFLSGDIFSSDFLYFLMSSVPEIIFNEIGNKKKSLNNQIEVWNPKNQTNLNEIKGVLTCHALSPLGDTIFLLSDLGRALRTAATLNKKRLTIMLANKDWSEYNWVASEIGNHNLINSFTWRTKSLYLKIGADVNECDLTNVPNGIPKSKIEELGTAYEYLVRSIFGSNYIGRKLKKEEVENLMDKYKLYSDKSKKVNFLDIPLIKEKLKPEKEVIINILRTLKRFDQNTFIYYFTQRFQQYNYNGFLKVAVRSEKNFDIPFYSLDKTDKNKGVDFSFYFENYKLYDDKFVIPYYFPSGSLYEEKDLIDDYINEVIMLDDFDDKDKIKRVFNKMNYPYDARLVSDFFSFVHFLLFPLDNNQNQNEYRSKIRRIINKYSKRLNNDDKFSLIASWKFYVKTPTDYKKRIENWSRSVFISDLTDKIQLPYHYFPYIDLLESKKKEIYSELLAELTKNVINIINFPQHFKK